MDYNNFQRHGSDSNAQVGRDFEAIAIDYFATKGISLSREFKLDIGIGKIKKGKRYDLGSEIPPILVECKSHTWTATDKSPSAKITVWNEAMYYFHLAPDIYQKYFFVLRDVSKKRGLTLCEYYIKTYAHMIPEDVTLLEYDPVSRQVSEYTANDKIKDTSPALPTVNKSTRFGNTPVSYKYAPLELYFNGLPSSTNEATFYFKQLEEILGFPLPNSARVYQAWWSNKSKASNHSQTRAWRNAGFAVKNLRLGSHGSVSFIRTKDLGL